MHHISTMNYFQYSDQDIITEGRKVLDFLYNFYRIDFRDMPDSYLLCGRQYSGHHEHENLRFRTFISDKRTNFRVVAQNEVRRVDSVIGSPHYILESKIYLDNPITSAG